jgi:hypothetical protein
VGKAHVAKDKKLLLFNTLTFGTKLALAIP